MKTEPELQLEIQALQHQISEHNSVLGELELRQEHLRAAPQIPLVTTLKKFSRPSQISSSEATSLKPVPPRSRS